MIFLPFRAGPDVCRPDPSRMLTDTGHNLCCTAQKSMSVFALQYRVSTRACGLTLWQLPSPSVTCCAEMPTFGVERTVVRLESLNEAQGIPNFAFFGSSSMGAKGRRQGSGARPGAPGWQKGRGTHVVDAGRSPER